MNIIITIHSCDTNQYYPSSRSVVHQSQSVSKTDPVLHCKSPWHAQSQLQWLLGEECCLFCPPPSHALVLLQSRRWWHLLLLAIRGGQTRRLRARKGEAGEGGVWGRRGFALYGLVRYFGKRRPLLRRYLWKLSSGGRAHWRILKTICVSESWKIWKNKTHCRCCSTWDISNRTHHSEP